ARREDERLLRDRPLRARAKADFPAYPPTHLTDGNHAPGARHPRSPSVTPDGPESSGSLAEDHRSKLPGDDSIPQAESVVVQCRRPAPSAFLAIARCRVAGRRLPGKKK